ncbi:hypothetical protein Aduo_000378 [Ancylostoma duodenale]
METTGCGEVGIEIKTKKDERLTGYRFCAKDYANVTLTAESNLVPIIAYSSNATAEFRAVLFYWANDSVSIVYEDDGNCYTFFENETWFVVITPECFDIVGVTHELGHALGLGHAHNRQDRDEYITVDDTIIEEFYNDVAEAYKKGVRKDYDATLEVFSD